MIAGPVLSAAVRPDSFAQWAMAAHAIRATTKRTEKGRLLEQYLSTLPDDALPIATRFFAGALFARHDLRTTGVGGATLFAAIVNVTGATEGDLSERYLVHGDGGDLAGELFEGRASSGVTLGDVSRFAADLSVAAGARARRDRVTELYDKLGGIEAQYLTKLLGGELRIGLKEAQVEEAIARAFGVPLVVVRRANLLRGDIGEVAALARAGSAHRAQLALFHPIGAMLAQPLPTAEAIAAALPAPFALEPKYDGIRAQAHVAGDRVAIFSRTLDDISESYPEVVAALRGLGAGIVLDGELLAYDPAEPARPLPFKALQNRLGRIAPDELWLASVPVAFVAFDILADDGVLVVDEPYVERRQRLERLAWRAPATRLTAMQLAHTAEEIELAFAAARAAGHEGLLAKDPASPYTPGRRGKSWIKLKRALGTLDVVVTAVERGHGKRRGVLSDYTFAVRASDADDRLLDIGKAYNGLTDAEIAELTPRFESLTIERRGGWHRVRPEVVLEVTFDVIHPSSRHAAGFALRFPRIVRVRDDKPASEIDTLARVRELATSIEHATAMVPSADELLLPLDGRAHGESDAS